MCLFSSTIIPTINRPSLSKTVLSVLEQDFSGAEFEVIVVNDSGQPLPGMDWQHSPRVKLINTQRRERSVARNTGAGIAKGMYLHFLDDDDILLPGALNAFWKLHHESNAIWLYGFYRSVDNDGKLVEEIRPKIAGNIFCWLIASEAIPFQTSLLNAQYFFKAGCFDPNLVGVEDRDVGRRMALLGDVAYTPEFVAQIRIGEVGSTTKWSTLAESDRLSREKALNVPNSYAQLRKPLESAYMRGRVCRACLASMVWNIQRGNVFLAMSRAILSLDITKLHIINPSFLRGLRKTA